MDLHLNLAVGRFTAVPGGTAPLREIGLKRGDAATITVHFYQGADPVVLPEPTDTIFVLKSTIAGPALALAATWNRDEDTGSLTAPLNLDTEELASAIGTVRVLRLLAEFTFTDSSGVRSTRIIDAIVENDLWKGTETTPLGLPTPEQWLLGDTAPVNAIPSTVTLDPAGSQNAIDIESTDPALTTAAIVVDSTTERTGLAAAKEGSELRITTGDKVVITIDTGSDNIQLFATGQDHTVTGVNIYTSNGITTYPGSGDWYYLRKTVTGWDVTLQTDLSTTEEFLVSSSITEWPDQASWGAEVSGSRAIASQAITALNALPGITAANAAGSDGTSNIAATTAAFTPGAPATAAPPYLRVAAGHLHIQEAGTWKKVALTNL